MLARGDRHTWRQSAGGQRQGCRATAATARHIPMQQSKTTRDPHHTHPKKHNHENIQETKTQLWDGGMACIDRWCSRRWHESIDEELHGTNTQKHMNTLTWHDDDTGTWTGPVTTYKTGITVPPAQEPPSDRRLGGGRRPPGGMGRRSREATLADASRLLYYM